MSAASYVAKDHRFHSDVVTYQWRRLNHVLQEEYSVCLDGLSLDICDVVAIARYGTGTNIDESKHANLVTSHNTLQQRLKGGEIIYDTNTGFGGSADVRISKMLQLQRVLIRELHYGIISLGSRENSTHRPLGAAISAHQHCSSLEHPAESTHLPKTWTRAAILIRINSLIKGFSAVRPVVVDRMQDLLKHDIVPMIPLRGNISASGDLSPLSYIGGAIQGKTTIRIISRESLYADQAFAQAGLSPVTLEAKEGLAVVNGTAISAAVGAIALHDAHTLAVLAQIMTAMSVEALTGSVESFHPIFAQARPHPGQIESAQNILAFLDNSKLVKVNNGAESNLRQDRYSIRTASQWIGPVLEDLVLAHQQITTECNSVTDNPLINQKGDSLGGGNFQAKAVASAMEKTRQGIQTIGRMLFTQCTEMINPATSNGLPPNLVAEDPSISYIFKGTDLGIAALQAELGFLANPVNHVQTAEMGNQALNSLALISARYTHTAIEVLQQLMATHLAALCQALDLRAMHMTFLQCYEEVFHWLVSDSYYSKGSLMPNKIFTGRLWKRLVKALDSTVSMDAEDRFLHVAKSLRTTFLDDEDFNKSSEQNPLKALEDFIDVLASSLKNFWCAHRGAYIMQGDATHELGRASKRIYRFIRHQLGVPFLCTAKLETPEPEQFNGNLGPISGRGKEAPTVGSYTGSIYRAIQNGTMAKVVVDVLQEVRNTEIDKV